MVKIWVFLHITAFFVGVGMTVGGELILHRLAASRNVPLIRSAFRLAMPIGRVGPTFFLIGGIFGLIATWQIGFGFFEPWSVMSYAIFAVAALAGGGFIGPWMEKVGKASAASPDKEPSPELDALLRDRKPRVATMVVAGAIVAAVYVMVLKPL